MRSFSWTRQVIQEACELPIRKGVFAILVTNIGAVGASQALIEGYPINAPLVAGQNGESWTVGGIPDAISQKSTLEILFPNGAGQVFVQMAYYTDL